MLHAFLVLACKLASEGKALLYFCVAVGEHMALLSPSLGIQVDPPPEPVSVWICTPLLHGEFNNIEFFIHFEVGFKVRKEIL